MGNKEKIRVLLQSVQTAFEAFRKGYQKGVLCDELFENFTQSLEKALGMYALKYDFLCGAESLNVDGITTGYAPKKGDTVIMDISVGKDGVWCDVCRTFFIEEVSSEQAAYYEMIYQSIKAGERVLKAGVTARELYEAVNGEYQKQGKRLIHHAGHRIGEEPLLQPQFLPENETSVADGMLVTLESGCYEGFGIRLENVYYVNEQGAENLFEDLMPMGIEEYILR